jgi:Cof subfamily protein (haloacid dehalogenase superfamily)
VVRGGPGIFRLVASDLDGTLLRSDGTISERSRAALAAATDAGVAIVIVSARGPRGVVEVAETGNFGGRAICSNGAIVIDLETGRVHAFRPIETEVAIALVHALRERLPGIRFAVEGHEFAHEPGFAAWNWKPPAGTRVDDVVELFDSPTAKLILRHEQHEVDVIAAVARELAADRADVAVSGPWAVEVTAAGVNKAAALAELCEELSLAASDVIAFGDMPNDVPMLAWAGHGVAVANAHPEALEIADEVTASNDADGVALTLERLLANYF